MVDCEEINSAQSDGQTIELLIKSLKVCPETLLLLQLDNNTSHAGRVLNHKSTKNI